MRILPVIGDGEVVLNVAEVEDLVQRIPGVIRKEKLQVRRIPEPG